MVTTFVRKSPESAWESKTDTQRITKMKDDKKWEAPTASWSSYGTAGCQHSLHFAWTDGVKFIFLATRTVNQSLSISLFLSLSRKVRKSCFKWMNHSQGKSHSYSSRNSHMKPAFDFNVRRNLAFAPSLESVPCFILTVSWVQDFFLSFFPSRKYC